MSDVDAQAVAAIVARTRAVVDADGPSTEQEQELRAAVERASPDERSLAAQELAEDFAAVEALHDALRSLGIEPS